MLRGSSPPSHELASFVPPSQGACTRRSAHCATWGLSLAGALAATSVLHPDDVLVIDERGPVTRAEMHRRSNALAHALGRRGIEAGDLVAVLCRNHRGFIDTAVSGASS